MHRIVVAGAGGGIGSALVDTLASRSGVERVFAIHRHPVVTTCERVTWLQADLRHPDTLEDAARQIAHEGGLDTLIVASGLLHGPEMCPEKSLRDLDADNLRALYDVNAVGPIMLLQACKNLFREADRPLACFLSAQIGSISDNRLGGWYGYRMSKAALNMAVKTASVELARIANGPIVVAVHPGTTRTALSSRFVRRRRTVSTAQEAAQRFLALLDRLDATDNGAFINYDGASLPW